MAVSGKIQTYEDEVVHLHGSRVDEPLHIPTAEEYWAITGRRLLSSPGENEPFSLRDGPAPVTIGSFTWSGLAADGMGSIDITNYFTVAQVTQDLPYTAWRVRGRYRSGYAALFLTSGDRTVSGTPVVTGDIDVLFQTVSGGWAMALDPYASGGISKSGSNYYYNPAVDLWFPINFQIELGYGSRATAIDTANDAEATMNWPAWTQPLKTDYPQYRGWSTGWACYNGYANAPHVVAEGTCPNTGSGGYVTPDEPEDE